MADFKFDVSDVSGNIFLNEGESLASEITVDCTEWTNKYEDPIIEVLVRHRGSRKYHVAAHTSITDGILTWEPDKDDTLKPGIGWWQVRCISGEEIVALTRKWEMCVLSSVPTESTEEVVTKAYVDEIVGNKQDVLTFDLFPTENSENPVTSGGVKAAIDELTDKKVMDLKMEQSFDEQTGEMTVTISYADGAPVVTGLTAEDFVNHSVQIYVSTMGMIRIPLMYSGVLQSGGSSLMVSLEVPGEGVQYIVFGYDSQTGEIGFSYLFTSAPYKQVEALEGYISDWKYGNFHNGEYYISGSKFAKRISGNTNMGTENTDFVYTSIGAELETLNNTIAALEARIAALEGN